MGNDGVSSSLSPGIRIYSTLKQKVTHAKPLMNRQAMKMGRIWTKEDKMPTKPSSSSVETSTILRPFVSARQPQKYEPMTIPEHRLNVKLLQNIGIFISRRTAVFHAKYRN